MADRMPKELEDLLFTMDDPDAIKDIQEKWLRYSAANRNYTKAYPEQFSHLVESNLKFKENKTIPTPAEQMRGYNDAIREEILDKLNDKNKKEQYEIDENERSENTDNNSKTSVKQFKLTFDDIGREQVDLSKTEYQRMAEKDIADKEVSAEKFNRPMSYSFSLTFDHPDTDSRDDMEQTIDDLEIDERE
jgi:hypothetical protein